MTLETVPGNWLLKQDGNKHQCRCPLLRRLRSLPNHLREWIDVEPRKYDESCFEVLKKMIRLHRHDPVQYFEKKTEQ